MCSAAAIVFPFGALTTRIWARSAATASMLSMPTPARPMIFSEVPAAISVASTWTCDRTMRASAPASGVAVYSRIAFTAAGTNAGSATRKAWVASWWACRIVATRPLVTAVAIEAPLRRRYQKGSRPSLSR